MLSTLIVALALTDPSQAASSHDIAAGGVVLHPAWMADVGDGWSPGLMECVGGAGFEVANALRSGGEGHACFNDTSFMGLGGGTVGIAAHPGPWFLSATGTGGVGWLGIEGGAEDWSATFLYLKPTLSAGMGFGWFGAELGLQTTIGFPIVQWQPEPAEWRPIVYGGAQFSLLFGEFWPHEPSPRVSHKPRDRTGRPLAIPTATPEPPPPASEVERQREAQAAQAAAERKDTHSSLERARVDLEHAANQLQREIDAALTRARTDGELSDSSRDALQTAANALQGAADALNEVGRELQQELEEELQDGQEAPPQEPAPLQQ